MEYQGKLVFIIVFIIKRLLLRLNHPASGLWPPAGFVIIHIIVQWNTIDSPMISHAIFYCISIMLADCHQQGDVVAIETNENFYRTN